MLCRTALCCVCVWACMGGGGGGGGLCVGGWLVGLLFELGTEPWNRLMMESGGGRQIWHNTK